MPADLEQVRAYLEYFRDLGVYDFYRSGEAVPEGEFARAVATQSGAAASPHGVPPTRSEVRPTAEARSGLQPWRVQVGRFVAYRRRSRSPWFWLASQRQQNSRHWRHPSAS